MDIDGTYRYPTYSQYSHLTNEAICEEIAKIDEEMPRANSKKQNDLTDKRSVLTQEWWCRIDNRVGAIPPKFPCLSFKQDLRK